MQCYAEHRLLFRKALASPSVSAPASRPRHSSKPRNTVGNQVAARRNAMRSKLTNSNVRMAQQAPTKNPHSVTKKKNPNAKNAGPNTKNRKKRPNGTNKKKKNANKKKYPALPETFEQEAYPDGWPGTVEMHGHRLQDLTYQKKSSTEIPALFPGANIHVVHIFMGQTLLIPGAVDAWRGVRRLQKDVWKQVKEWKKDGTLPADFQLPTVSYFDFGKKFIANHAKGLWSFITHFDEHMTEFGARLDKLFGGVVEAKKTEEEQMELVYEHNKKVEAKVQAHTQAMSQLSFPEIVQQTTEALAQLRQLTRGQLPAMLEIMLPTPPLDTILLKPMYAGMVGEIEKYVVIVMAGLQLMKQGPASSASAVAPAPQQTSAAQEQGSEAVAA